MRWPAGARCAGRNWPSTTSSRSENRRATGLLLDQALAGIASQPIGICETQHVTTMLGLVEAGLGVAVVPSMAMPGADHPLLVSVPLIDPEVTRKVGLIKRRGRSLGPAAQQLYELCVEMQGRKPAPKAFAKSQAKVLKNSQTAGSAVCERLMRHEDQSIGTMQFT